MKKNGFTLIELLAVIVILAIIALIATPIVLNIINGAKTSSNERSGELYIKAVENAIMKKQMNGTDTVELNKTYTVQSDGSICIVSNNICTEGTTITIDVDGEVPETGGTLTINEKGVVTEYNMTISGTSIVKVDSNSNVDDGYYDIIINDNIDWDLYQTPKIVLVFERNNQTEYFTINNGLFMYNYMNSYNDMGTLYQYESDENGDYWSSFLDGVEQLNVSKPIIENVRILEGDELNQFLSTMGVTSDYLIDDYSDIITLE